MRRLTRLVHRVISGGQTGVDRGALDAALDVGLAIGGWCPPDRRDELGPIPANYPLEPTPREASDAAPHVSRSLRTEWNVRDADATIVLVPLACAGDAGTDFTIACARRMGRPLLVLDPAEPEAARNLARWLRSTRPGVLNVAGPSERTAPGIGARTQDVLVAALEHASTT